MFLHVYEVCGPKNLNTNDAMHPCHTTQAEMYSSVKSNEAQLASQAAAAQQELQKMQAAADRTVLLLQITQQVRMCVLAID